MFIGITYANTLKFAYNYIACNDKSHYDDKIHGPRNRTNMFMPIFKTSHSLSVKAQQ